ncbi:hypothetical protein K8R04_04930 [Candidatus Uhrbacteria bacterium]|nr:hypothetical protein [Candidatus Uhrbacteria bacterium]
MERKQLIIIGSVVGSIAVVALVALIIMLRIRATADLQPITTVNTPAGPAVQVPVGNTQTTPERERLAAQELDMLAARPKDTDGDGLSDDEEVQLGTNINDGDTDDDGSSDWEEVKTLKTDPTKPDTGVLEKRIADQKQRLSTVSSTRPEPTVTTPVAPTTPTASPDADADGLTAEQEANLGTDPNNADTDGDGLTDRQEVETYKTDPLKADSDNDTFKDGAEVQAGYNPLGPGKCARTTCIP